MGNLRARQTQKSAEGTFVSITVGRPSWMLHWKFQALQACGGSKPHPRLWPVSSCKRCPMEKSRQQPGADGSDYCPTVPTSGKACVVWGSPANLPSPSHMVQQRSKCTPLPPDQGVQNNWLPISPPFNGWVILETSLELLFPSQPPPHLPTSLAIDPALESGLHPELPSPPASQRETSMLTHFQQWRGRSGRMSVALFCLAARPQSQSHAHRASGTFFQSEYCLRLAFFIPKGTSSRLQVISYRSGLRES